MQIRTNKTIILSLITSSIIFTGCLGTKNNTVFIQENDNNQVLEKEYRNYNSLTSIGKEEKENKIFYKNYLNKLSEKSKIRLTQKEPIMSTTLIPSMYIDVNSFEGLVEVLEELQETYSVFFDNRSYKYLQNKIKNNTVIDMSKRSFTYEELMNKIALKFDVSYKRVDNTYKFYIEETVKYFVPYEIEIGDKAINHNLKRHTSTEILNTLKAFVKDKENSKFVYDKVTGYLYVTAKPEEQSLIKQYIEDLDELNNVLYDFNVSAYEVSTRNGIEWNKLVDKVDELDTNTKIEKNTNPDDNNGYYMVLNDEYTLKNGVKVRDKIRDFLSNTGADVEYLDTYHLNTKNNKEAKVVYANEYKYVSDIEEKTIEDGTKIITPITKTINLGDELYIVPRYNKNTDSIDIKSMFNIKRIKDIQDVEINGKNFKIPTIYEKNVQNNISAKDGSFIVLSSMSEVPKYENINLWGKFKNLFTSKNNKEVVFIIEVKSRTTVGEVK